jgi:hypothetical protein
MQLKNHKNNTMKTFLKFKKRNWTKWPHIMFVEEYGTGNKTYQLLARVDLESGLREYKKVFVGDRTHYLAANLNSKFDNLKEHE